MRWPGYKSQAWRRVRADVIKPRCEWCGSPDRLMVDHIRDVRTHPELWDDPSNLRTLCLSCHNRRSHRDGHRGRPALATPRIGLDGRRITDEPEG